MLAELLGARAGGVAALRLLSGVSVDASRPPVAVNLPLPPRRQDLLGGESRPPIEEEALRVSASTLDVLVEQATNLGVLRVPLSASSEELAAAAREARGLAGQIREALRLIGPPKPWGAPARALSMLAQVADRLGAITAVLDGTEKRVGAVRARVAEQSEVVSSTIAGLRTRTAAGLFSQVEQHADSEARRLGKEIGVERSGADTPIDRRLSDALVEPIRQLMRNAIAHGIELPEDRRARGKPPAGRVRLSAEQQGTSLLITISDDGRGVDLGLLRERAITLGLVSRLTAETLSDAALLTLLFYPGFSMREEVDLLAGRGVGLDLTLAAVHRLGGSIHLDSKVGAGLTATIAVPASRGLTRVLWVRSASRLFALPVANVREVLSERRAGARVLTLAAALPEAIAPGPPSSPRRSPVLIGISSTLGRDEAVIAVDEALGIDEVVLRPGASVVRTTGPFSGAIAWGDEIRLALDPLRLVQLASVGPM